MLWMTISLEIATMSGGTDNHFLENLPNFIVAVVLLPEKNDDVILSFVSLFGKIADCCVRLFG